MRDIALIAEPDINPGGSYANALSQSSRQELREIVYQMVEDRYAEEVRRCE